MSDSRTSTSGIAKVVKKIHIGEEKTDAAYWRALPYQARIEALEQIRLEYNTWKYNAHPGLQRVVNIIKR